MRALRDLPQGRAGGQGERAGHLGEGLAGALERPEAYPGEVGAVEVCETHVSWVFLAGDRAYKVKKPVRFPFLDYSTLEKRRHFCAEEVRLNRRLAPDVYLGVAPITADGRVHGKGEPVEVAVEMTRLPHDRMLDGMLDRGEADAADLERVADVVADFHARTGRVPMPDVRGIVARNLDDLEPHAPAAWHARLRAFLERPPPAGRPAVDGHGDLHAANVCLPADRVVIYDCIEFDPAYRHGDPAADVAFLAMDLQRRGAWDLARTFLGRYAARAPGDVAPVLPFYACHRACVRALVESLRGRPEPARAYLRLAVHVALPPALIVVCGLPGAGKSHLARHLARALDAAWLRSDEVRKELCGVAPTERWDGGYLEGPYRPDVTARTYRALLDRALAARHAGRTVVVDAACNTRAQRALFRDRGGLVVEVACAEAVVRARMRARGGDAGEVSDARFDTYRRARAEREPVRGPDVAHDGAAAPDAALDALLTRRARSAAP